MSFRQRSPELKIKTRENSPNNDDYSESPQTAEAEIRQLLPLKTARMSEVQSDLQIFKIVFELFDKEKTGFVSEQDVIAITVSMKKDVDLVKQVYQKIAAIRDTESIGYSYGLVSFGEFATLMWEVQQI